ncbi:Serine/threonine-protein kinase CTR1, partial [Mucuna pruriens]
MEMPARRYKYSLVRQTPDDYDYYYGSTAPPPPPLFGPSSGEGNRASDWDFVVDHRQGNRFRNLHSPIGLQRQSSGSSFGESSLSGGFHAPTPSILAASESDFFGSDGSQFGEDRARFPGAAAARCGRSSGKSWVQHVTESYQLQLELALRLLSEAKRAINLSFLDPESAARSSSSCSADEVSHKFWVNGCLLYYDKIPDGFYLIHGMDPYVWNVCMDLQENGRIPSIETLKSIDPSSDSSLEIVLVDRRSDPSLKELQSKVHDISCGCITTADVVDQLAKLVCNCMGGLASVSEDDLFPKWRNCINDLRDCLGSIVVPIGSLSTGLCRQRAVLFKVLADTIDLPCRIAKGCKYCSRNDASSCLVRFGLDREYMVDLIAKPGCLCEPDSLLNGSPSISFSSPLCFPRLKPGEPTIDFRSLAKEYFLVDLSAMLVFGSGSAEQCEGQYKDRNPETIPNDNNISSFVPLHPQTYHPNTHDRGSETFKSGNLPLNIVEPTMTSKDSLLLKHNRPDHRDTQTPLIPSNPTRKFSLGMEDLDIPWTDLVLKRKIGSGGVCGCLEEKHRERE